MNMLLGYGAIDVNLTEVYDCGYDKATVLATDMNTKQQYVTKNMNITIKLRHVDMNIRLRYLAMDINTTLKCVAMDINTRLWYVAVRTSTLQYDQKAKT